MKKKYMEPVMVVEDFTVSEMIAANCDIPKNELTFVQYTNKAIPCPIGDEKTVEWGTAYSLITEAYNGDYNIDPDQYGPHQESGEFAFTESYHRHSNNDPYVCGYDASNLTFHDAVQIGLCTADSGLLQNS